MEFVVEGFVSFSEAERKCFHGMRVRYINYVPLWFNMILCDKGII